MVAMTKGAVGAPGPVGQGQRRGALVGAAQALAGAGAEAEADARPSGPQDVGRPGTWRFLGNGVYGVAVALQTVRPPGATMVLKLSVNVDFDKCLPAADLLCSVKASVPLTDWAWAGAFKAAREHAAHGLLLKHMLEGGQGSPHIVQAVAWGTWTLPGPPQSIVDVLKALQVKDLPEALDTHKILSKPTAAMQWCLQEFAGVALSPVLKTCTVPACGLVPGALAVYQSAALQALVGIMHLHQAGIHHNDLHASNVLGTPVTTKYLYYVVGVRGPWQPLPAPRPTTPQQLVALLKDPTARKACGPLRLVRVPTWGALWRVSDLGGATSHAFHALDHGMMARTWFGGPKFAAKVMGSLVPKGPLHAFDAMRLLGSLHRNADTALRAPRLAPARRRVQQWLQAVLNGIQERGQALARAAKRPLVFLGAAGVPAVPVSFAAKDEARLLKAVIATDAASEDVGATRAALLHAATLAKCVVALPRASKVLAQDPKWADNLFFV
jgi:hypothetical protein